MSWLNTFKIALIKEDSEKLSSLLDTLPQFELENDMHEAKQLFLQAMVLFEKLEKESSIEMQKIRKARKYLEH